eukprot:6678488-Lingulodinium_polyedra.AAC.1
MRFVRRTRACLTKAIPERFLDDVPPPRPPVRARRLLSFLRPGRLAVSQGQVVEHRRRDQ